jgi:hypothetical protein
MTTLAEKLRAWKDSLQAFEDAAKRTQTTAEDVPDEYRYANRADDYLRGYDDALKCVYDGTGGRDTYKVLWSAIDKMGKAAGANTGVGSDCDKIANAVVKKLDAITARTRDSSAEAWSQNRELRAENDALTARVRELESTLLDEHSRLAQAEAQPAAVGVVGAVRWGVVDRQGMMASNYTHDARDLAEAFTSYCKGSMRVVAIVDPDAIVPLASGTPVGVIATSGSLFGLDKLNHPGWSDCAPVYRGIAQPAQERAG